jgi:hypothetical protein
MVERRIAKESTVCRHFCLTYIHEPSRVHNNRRVLQARLQLGLRLLEHTRGEEKVFAAHLDLPVNIPRGSHPFPSQTRK